MNFILCLAGLGKRFTEKKIFTPKYLLPIEQGQKKTILEEIIENLPGSDCIASYTFVLNYRHEEYINKVKYIAEKLVRSFNIFLVNDTNGQAETANIALDLLCRNVKDFDPQKDTIAFLNGDTVTKTDILEINKAFDIGAKGIIDTFFSNSENFSYVKTNKNNQVIQIVEKKVISNKATTGLYFFNNAYTYQKYYKYISNHCQELFISDVYIEMLKNNEKIIALEPSQLRKPIILGTPDEYFAWLRR